jgi:hypothetical protein
MAQAAQSSRSTLVTVILIAVAVLAIYGALSSYQLSVQYASQYPDAFSGDRGRVRFAPASARIPPVAELGYLTDLDPAQPAYAPAFLSAQYALAPRALIIVNANNKPELAVGNFTKPQDFAAAGAALGYALETDLGNGVILFRRKSS